MSFQRTFFARNVLIVSLAIPMLVAIAVADLFAILVEKLEKRWESGRGWKSRMSIALAFSGLLVVFTPWATLSESFERQLESRNEAAAWIAAHLPPRTHLIVPRELGLDPRTIPKSYPISYFRAKDVSFEQLMRKYPGAVLFAPTYRPKKLTLRLPKNKILFHSGKRPVKLDERVSTTPGGNPEFSLVQL